MLKKTLLIIFVLVVNLFAYDKTQDDKNVYYSSEHFVAIGGLSYSGSTTLENFATKILDAAEASWQKEVDELGFKEPTDTTTKKIDIYIGNKSAYNYETSSYETISSSYAGWATAYSDDRPYFLLNDTLSDNVLKVTIAHEFFHTVQYAYFNPQNISMEKWVKNIWWLEATAVLMEDEVYDDINDYIGFLDSFFTKSYENIETFDGSHEYTTTIYARYFREKFGMEIIKKLLSSIENSGESGFFELLDETLQSEHNSTLAQELQQMGLYLSDAKSHFKDGEKFPTLKSYELSSNKSIQKGGMLFLTNTDNFFVTNSENYSSMVDINTTDVISDSSDTIILTNHSSTPISSDAISTKKLNSTSSYFIQNEGWNLVSYGCSLHVDSVLDENSELIYGYENNSWELYSKNSDIYDLIVSRGYSTFDRVESSKAYWVLSSGKSLIENAECVNISNEIVVKKGWNFLSASKSLSAKELQNENILHVWQYHNGSWKLHSNIEHNLSIENIEKIYKEDGFWLYAKDDAHITLN